MDEVFGTDSTDVVAVQWPRQVDANTIRARWVQAQWRFSPFTGWPPPRGEQAPMRFADREADLHSVGLALGVVSSWSALWEVQAQIVDYCSHAETDPGASWFTIADLDPAGETWDRQDGISLFLARTQLAVPPHVITAAARVMSGAFWSPTLDGLGYVVARMAGPDLEECLNRCGEDNVCLLQCLAEG